MCVWKVFWFENEEEGKCLVSVLPKVEDAINIRCRCYLDLPVGDSKNELRLRFVKYVVDERFRLNVVEMVVKCKSFHSISRTGPLNYFFHTQRS